MRSPIVITRLFACLVLACQLGGPASAQATLPPGVVASVDGIPIPTAKIADRLWRERGSVTLDFVVKTYIVRAEAAKRGIVVSPEEIQARLLDYKTAFMTAAGHTPLDWEQFTKRYGLKNIEEQQANDLLVVRIGEDEAKKATLTDSEKARVLEDLERAAHKVHARILLIGIGPEFGGRTDSAAMALANEALAKIAGGMTWDEACRVYSDDVSTRTHGGDLGLVTRQQLEKPLEDVLFSAKPGPESRQVVRLLNGYAVAELLSRTDNLPTEEETRKALDDTLKRKQALAKEITTWYPRVAATYDVERLLPYRRGD